MIVSAIRSNVACAGIRKKMRPVLAKIVPKPRPVIAPCSAPVCAPVVVQVSRSPQQAQLRRFLTGCVVVPLGETEAHDAGRLPGMTGTADVVDAVVGTVALRRKAMNLTNDPDDIERHVTAFSRGVALVTG